MLNFIWESILLVGRLIDEYLKLIFNGHYNAKTTLRYFEVDIIIT